MSIGSTIQRHLLIFKDLETRVSAASAAHLRVLQAQGSDWNGQVKLGNSQFVGVNYLQSVTPHLALGGEAFWLGQQKKSGAGFAARYANDAHVATAQVATTGLVSLTYLRRISEKVRQSTCTSSRSHLCLLQGPTVSVRSSTEHHVHACAHGPRHKKNSILSDNGMEHRKARRRSVGGMQSGPNQTLRQISG